MELGNFARLARRPTSDWRTTMADQAVHVTHMRGDQFEIDIRGHKVLVDQPIEAGGEDTAATPTELFLAGLASCVAFYARRYLARHDLSPEGLVVDLDFAIGDRPVRVNRIDVRITPPTSLPPERRAAFLAVASGCTVHHTLEQPPTVTFTMDSAA
jgi:uncharacterized OsmC-like protein